MSTKFIEIVRTGYNRDVLLIGKYALKFPTFRDGDRSFILGMACNQKERDLARSEHPQLAKLLYFFPFGLCSIYQRYYHVLDRPLTADEIKNLPIYNHDPKIGNYAMEDSKIIVLDYGYGDTWLK